MASNANATTSILTSGVTTVPASSAATAMEEEGEPLRNSLPPSSFDGFAAVLPSEATAMSFASTTENGTAITKGTSGEAEEAVPGLRVTAASSLLRGSPSSRGPLPPLPPSSSAPTSSVSLNRRVGAVSSSFAYSAVANGGGGGGAQANPSSFNNNSAVLTSSITGPGTNSFGGGGGLLNATVTNTATGGSYSALFNNANNPPTSSSSSSSLSKPRLDPSQIRFCPVDQWVPDAHVMNCMAPDCHTSFSLFNRRQHCPMCGRVFCAACCANAITVPTSSTNGSAAAAAAAVAALSASSATALGSNPSAGGAGVARGLASPTPPPPPPPSSSSQLASPATHDGRFDGISSSSLAATGSTLSPRAENSVVRGTDGSPRERDRYVGFGNAPTLTASSSSGSAAAAAGGGAAIAGSFPSSVDTALTGYGGGGGGASPSSASPAAMMGGRSNTWAPGGNEVLPLTSPSTSVTASTTIRVCNACYYESQLVVSTRQENGDRRRRSRGELKMFQRALLVSIFGYLSLRDLNEVSLVSADFYFLSRDNVIWYQYNVTRWLKDAEQPQLSSIARAGRDSTKASGRRGTAATRQVSAQFEAAQVLQDATALTNSESAKRVISLHARYNFTQFIDFARRQQMARCEGLSSFYLGARMLLSSPIRIAIVGPSHVGKTACIRAFLGEDPNKMVVHPTIGFRRYQHTVRVKGGVAAEVTLHLYDLSGEARYDALRRFICRNCHAVGLCYDPAKKVTLVQAADIMMDLETALGPQPVVVCGLLQGGHSSSVSVAASVGGGGGSSAERHQTSQVMYLRTSALALSTTTTNAAAGVGVANSSLAGVGNGSARKADVFRTTATDQYDDPTPSALQPIPPRHRRHLTMPPLSFSSTTSSSSVPVTARSVYDEKDTVNGVGAVRGSGSQWEAAAAAAPEGGSASFSTRTHGDYVLGAAPHTTMNATAAAPAAPLSTERLAKEEEEEELDMAHSQLADSVTSRSVDVGDGRSSRSSVTAARLGPQEHGTMAAATSKVAAKETSVDGDRAVTSNGGSGEAEEQMRRDAEEPKRTAEGTAHRDGTTTATTLSVPLKTAVTRVMGDSTIDEGGAEGRSGAPPVVTSSFSSAAAAATAATDSPAKADASNNAASLNPPPSPSASSSTLPVADGVQLEVSKEDAEGITVRGQGSLQCPVLQAQPFFQQLLQCLLDRLVVATMGHTTTFADITEEVVAGTGANGGGGQVVARVQRPRADQATADELLNLTMQPSPLDILLDTK